MDTWILSMARTISRRRVVAWTVATALVALFVFAQRRYVENFLGGPYTLGEEDLAAIRDASETPKYFVTVGGSEAIDTGIQQISIRTRNGVETGRSVTAAYYALVVGERLLICKSGSGPRTTFEGELAPLPAGLDQQMFDSADMRELRPRFYPFYLSDESFRFPGYWAIAGLLVLGLLLVTNGVSAWRRLQDPSTHPVAQRATAWGDPHGLAVAAEREVGSPRFKASGWALTDQFLVQTTFFTFDLLRFTDLLWAYKKITKHSVNFIPTGKTYDAILVCKGGTATLQASEQTVDQILGFAAQRTPWAVFGYSQELEQLFRGKTAEFHAAVEARRQDFAQQQRTA